MLYRPADSVLADVIPFYWKGEYHLFYLRDWRDEARHGKGTPWWHLVTRDFVHFEEWGEALARGAADEQDQWVFTGCVYEHAGVFHIFYTGHNPAVGAKPNGSTQTILHATSPDLRTWTKDRSFNFVPQPGYLLHDWRDPFIWPDEKTGEFQMIFMACKPIAHTSQRGCTARAVSRDLRNWEMRPPLWDPDEFWGHECPDLFRISDWWYLVYFTNGERGTTTYYRMSKSLDGPWIAPRVDTFDGTGFCAAKTAGDGTRRFGFGWLQTRVGDKDEGGGQWGGNLLVHEIVQRDDGELRVRIPDTIATVFAKRAALGAPGVQLGNWDIDANAGRFVAKSRWRFSSIKLGALPPTCLIDATIRFAPGTHNFGLLLRDSNLDRHYRLRFEPFENRIVLDRVPRGILSPMMVERPLTMSPDRPIRLRVMVDETCFVAYVDDSVALSARMYDYRDGDLGLFVAEGEATFEEVQVRTPA